MEQFNALPFPQKIGALVGVAVALAGLIYYALIIPEQELLATATQQKDQLKSEIQAIKKKLEDYGLKDKTVTDLEKEEKKLKESLTRFAEMLPRAKELERFVTGISETARNSGLELLSFKKGKLNYRDYYLEVPIDMQVRGTFRELIGFLKTISEKDRRAVNIRNLAIQTRDLPIQKIVTKYERRRKDETPDGVTLKPLDPAAKLMQLVRAHEEAIGQGVELDAEFTTYVFSYTGKPAAAKYAAKNNAAVKRKNNLRKELSAQ